MRRQKLWFSPGASTSASTAVCVALRSTSRYTAAQASQGDYCRTLGEEFVSALLSEEFSHGGDLDFSHGV